MVLMGEGAKSEAVGAGADPISVTEYEVMVLGRHLTSMPGRKRRTGGVLDQSAYALLSMIRILGPRSISEFSAHTGLDASTLNRQTAALVRDGFAERIPDPAGGLARKFRATECGDKALDDERAASRAAIARATGDWSEKDRRAFAELLGRFNRSIEGRLGRDFPRPPQT